MIVKNKKVKTLLYIIEWIPILGFVYTTILGVINMIDYYKGRVSLAKYGSDHPNYLKALFLRYDTSLSVINGLWLGTASGWIIRLLFLC